jgi:malate/lactate dehydrogenase
MRKKVTIVGAGNVGATAAMRILDRELADVVLIDILITLTDEENKALHHSASAVQGLVDDLKRLG